MNEHQKLTPSGASLVKHFESCSKPDGDKFKPYRCPANVLTIGWGHTNDHGRKFDEKSRWSQTECDNEFLSDMAGFENSVRRLAKVDLEPYQFDALVSFAYNCGSGALEKSTLLKKVNAKDFEAAALEFHKWNKATVNGKKQVVPGLVRRRACESLMFQNIQDFNFDGKPDPMPQEVASPEG